MLDIKLLRESLDLVENKLATKNYKLDKIAFEKLNFAYKENIKKTENLQQQRNSLSKEFAIKKKNNLDISSLEKKLQQINQDLKKSKEEFTKVNSSLQTFLDDIPNIPSQTTPIGVDETCNKVIKKYGNIKKFDFEPLDHTSLCENLDGIDFQVAAKISGARFSVLKGKIAKLHRVLADFMLDIHTNEHDYLETYVPFLVNQNSLYGTGQMPKFSQDLFHTKNLEENKTQFSLIPTAEVPLTNLVAKTTLTKKDLPLRFISHTPCFRSEAGSYGKDIKGLIRQHQFQKVELVHITTQENSHLELEKLTNNAKKILDLLELPYQQIELCTGDLGFSACKTYDLEVWLPSQNTYREISSCSNMLDFQARRMQAKYKTKSHKKPLFVHTLNGSGLAVGRTLVAILENYQQQDKRILLPKVLQKYFSNSRYL